MVDDDWWEAFVESGWEVVAELLDGEVRVTATPKAGVAVRLRRSGTSSFAFTNDFSDHGLSTLLDEITFPVGMLSSLRAFLQDSLPRGGVLDMHRHQRHQALTEAGAVLGVVQDRSSGTAAPSPRASYLRRLRMIALVASDGSGTGSASQFGRVKVSVSADGATGSATHIIREAAPLDLGEMPAQLVTDASLAASLRATAEPPTSSTRTVIFAPSAAGLLVHEAIGHPLEADVVAAGSALWRLRGQRFSHPSLHVSDIPGSDDAWVPATIDEEGVPCRRTDLVRDGEVVGAISDRGTAALTGSTSTGHARRGSYRFRPIPRARHTATAPGPTADADLLSDTDDGVFVDEISGADADPARGRFIARAELGRVIRRGRPAETLVDFTIRGDLGDFRSLDGVGDRCEVENAFCGKAAAWLPVSYSAPALRFGRLAVHGRAAGSGG